ncbi:hypothetical protein BFV94_4308 [Alteromonas macleodii]|nr:hypothetical protein BFV93_4696 [Alteromonas macleodii]OES25782.1 hypothetical protein BFV94_4308 [Alteromonas macleodii]OES38964.1 hypothetical protein BFV96_4458 [Alteromonas macleodii]
MHVNCGTAEGFAVVLYGSACDRLKADCLHGAVPLPTLSMSLSGWEALPRKRIII